MADPAIYPVSGGSEAIETALKLARATQLARGEPDRLVVFARWGSYHGNTLGALDLSGRRPLRRAVRGLARPVPPRQRRLPVPRRASPGSQALGTTQALVDELDQAFTMAGPGTVAAFVAEPIVGATLGAVEPPEGLLAGGRRRLPAPRGAADRRRGDDGLRPDRRPGSASRTTASSPTCSSPRRARRPATGRSGSSPPRARCSTRSPGAGGRSCTGSPTRTSPRRRRSRSRCCGSSRRESLVAASATKGERLLALLHDRLDANPAVGDIRGRGLLVGVELVRDRGDARAVSARPRASSRRS